MESAAGCGLVLDATYTAKAFAAALAYARQHPDQKVLFWHTLSTAPELAIDAAPLPPRLERLFR